MDGSTLSRIARSSRQWRTLAACAFALGIVLIARTGVANSLEAPPAFTLSSTAAGVTASEVRNTASTQPTNSTPSGFVSSLPIALKRPLKKPIPKYLVPEKIQQPVPAAVGTTSTVIDVIPDVPEGNIIRPRTQETAISVTSGDSNIKPLDSAKPKPASPTLVRTDLSTTPVPTPAAEKPAAALPENPMLNIAARALEKVGGGVREKVMYARSVANNGDVEGARAMCQALMTQADAADMTLARNCVHFDVPLVKLRQLMKDSRMRDANLLIDNMLKWVGNVPEYREYLLSVRKITAERAARENPEAAKQTIMNVVQTVLERYHEEQGRFPRSYTELNEALPADAPPLTDYDIVSYYATDDAFSVKIQARENPLEVLSLHKTGLIK